jgi:RimJ/RimL family protein N-acetyltransferase
MATDRLTIREWTRSDANRYLDIYGKPEVMRWLGGSAAPLTSREQAERSIDRIEARRTNDDPIRGYWAVVRRTDDVVAGTVLLERLQGVAGEYEIGWHFHPDSWGHGYATEAAASVLDWGFDHELAEILAVVFPGNTASLAVCRRLHMTGLGITSRYYDSEMELFRIRAADRPGR